MMSGARRRLRGAGEDPRRMSIEIETLELVRAIIVVESVPLCLGCRRLKTREVHMINASSR